MKVRLDENLGRTPQRLLEGKSMMRRTCTTEEISGTSGPEVWSAVQAEGRLLVSLDTDFADVQQYPPGTHGGVLLLRPHSRSREAATTLLRRVLRAHPLDTLRGCLTVATEAHVRVRRPAGGGPEGTS